MYNSFTNICIGERTIEQINFGLLLYEFLYLLFLYLLLFFTHKHSYLVVFRGNACGSNNPKTRKNKVLAF